ncbi:hypothetical protein [Betafusellovirus yellowstonense]|uniref:Uncharacterized protein n=1 Tax=Betafusellovirus yellowstonense TaxID=693629 RepID=D1GF99_9VIRU|nr:hypothetical protein SSSV1_gp15 [Acidianus spindle-shaped virus 1]ACZ35800.1 hypothetical protein [Acidianus spindle-shaped virus 1]
MESALSLFTSIETHGIVVRKHINWDYVGIAITTIGTIVVFKDTDWSYYGVYSPFKGRYHIHMPFTDIVIFDDKSKDVLNEVWGCLHFAECYIEKGVVYSINKFRMRSFIPFGVHTTTKL